MSKKSGKKRNKKYTGVNARERTDLVRVHKVDAVVRSNWRQWLFDHKDLIKKVLIVILVVAAIVAGLIALF